MKIDFESRKEKKRVEYTPEGRTRIDHKGEDQEGSESEIRSLCPWGEEMMYGRESIRGEREGCTKTRLDGTEKSVSGA